MSRATLSLNNDWEFTWTYYAGKDRPILSADEAKRYAWHPAAVPGNIQADLQEHVQGDDIFFADNADHYRWCEEVDFWYRRQIDPVDLPAGAHAILEFGGLDCFATIWIDGKQIGKHDNMFIPCRLDITEYLRPDKPVEILVRLAANMQEVEASHRDPCNHPPMQRIRSRKAQISYGWDIGPRIVTTGIWRPVTLDIIDRGILLHAGARTVDLEDGHAKMELVATIDWHARPERVTVRGQFGPVSVEHQQIITGGLNDVVIPFDLPDPTLWWPRGYGEPFLYDFDLSLDDTQSKSIDSTQGTFGVCKVEMVQEKRKDGHMGLRFKVNHRDYFARGMNWTPCDAIFGRIRDDRIEKLVGLAADANINMLRVWGGGVYEPESFWQACDRAGILVWQDFMFACSLYPQDNEFRNAVTREAAGVIRAFRHHVSLAVWAGDNEIDCLCIPEAGTLISRQFLPEVLKQIDPHRPYIPSSPFSRPGEDPNDPRSGDCHLWNHLIRPDDPFYTNYHANFVSEIGRISLPGQKTIDAFLPKEKQWPPKNSLWFYHSSDTNRWRSYRNISHVLQCVEANGYPEPKSLAELIKVTQKIQADAYRFWIEHYGSDPQCWGLLLWNLCDCWPQLSDAVISYDLEPKEAYYAVKEAYAKLDR